MKHIVFPKFANIDGRRLPFFLATEEWVARFLPADEYFFSWQVNPTVICGRNQDIPREVNLQYCSAHGIDVVRRRSGGGAVFADRDNFMFSLIAPGDEVREMFAAYTAMISKALTNIGVPAEPSGRNDITINGKKVSGNAFYHIPGRCIAHGTMLYKFDPAQLGNALTPSRAKLESKKVKSVPSRVTSLSEEGISLGPKEFEAYMIESITDGQPYVLTADDIAKIEEIESGYYAPGFLRISDTAAAVSSDRHVSCSKHVEGLGEICVDFETDKEERMRNFRISGDFFIDADIAQLGRRLEGKKISEIVLDDESSSQDNPLKEAIISLLKEISISPKCI
ncbi:MAG: lipoate--protein ligase family protein [Candidatus Amulumruptor caecigallinarius]|nr:lipoate--protein ligase family protein [Candidatus Amulumruptor caecigallinarius]